MVILLHYKNLTSFAQLTEILMHKFTSPTLSLFCCLFLVGGCAGLSKIPKELSKSVRSFDRIKSDFKHEWDGTSTHPFTGAAAIDIDNSGNYKVFVSGGNGQNDALLDYQNGRLVDVIDGMGLSMKVASYGAAAADIDNDGLSDLIVCRDDGVWLHINKGKKFTAHKLDINFPDQETPVAVTLSDIDHDGDLDVYVSTFTHYTEWRSSIFNDAKHAKENHLLRNDGDLQFTDITLASNVAGTQNTFVSLFTDLDGDRYQDLVLSNNTGEVEIFRNNKDTTFTPIDVSSGLGYWMGLDAADYDGDGDQDLMLSNVSDTIPEALLRGDLRDDQTLTKEWLLLRNDGNMQFHDVTESVGLTGQGFGWGAAFEDLNLDGTLDLLVAQSYIKWPPHKLLPLKARSFLQTKTADGSRFIHVKKLGLQDPHFGQSPVIVDLDHDGLQDVLWINMNGPVLARMNRHKDDVVTIDIPKNARWIGATSRALYGSGQMSYSKEITSGAGMQTDQTAQISFAIPEEDDIQSIEITRIDGEVMLFEGPFESYTRLKVEP